MNVLFNGFAFLFYRTNMFNPDFITESVEFLVPFSSTAVSKPFPCRASVAFAVALLSLRLFN